MEPSSDGQRFLAVFREQVRRARITVVMNRFDELRSNFGQE